MQKLCQTLVNYMALLIVAAGALAAARPESFAWAAPHIPWMLGLIMFGMGMTLTVEDFVTLARRPWEVAAGAVAQFTIMPVAAWVLAKAFALPPELAVGVVLLGSCPGGTASNVIAYLARGDVALSVTMTMASTLLAPLVTPLLTWGLAGAWIDISLAAMMLSIAKMVLAPVLLGVLLNRFCGKAVRLCLPALPLFSAVAIALTVGGVVALSAEKLFAHGLAITAVVVCHNAIGLGCGYAFARLLRMPTVKSRTVAIEVGLQNSGLATALATVYFGAAAGIPGAIFSVWQNVSGSLLANLWRRADALDENITLPTAA